MSRPEILTFTGGNAAMFGHLAEEVEVTPTTLINQSLQASLLLAEFVVQTRHADPDEQARVIFYDELVGYQRYRIHAPHPIEEVEATPEPPADEFKEIISPFIAEQADQSLAMELRPFLVEQLDRLSTLLDIPKSLMINNGIFYRQQWHLTTKLGELVLLQEHPESNLRVLNMEFIS